MRCNLGEPGVLSLVGREVCTSWFSVGGCYGCEYLQAGGRRPDVGGLGGSLVPPFLEDCPGGD